MATWKDIIIQAFENLGGVSKYGNLYKEIARITPSEKLSKNTTWKSTVRREIQSHSSSSKGFKGQKDKDIFYSVEGLGNGIWGLKNYLGSFQTSRESIEDIDITTERRDIKVRRIIRDTKIIRELKALHDNKCQLCSIQIQINNNIFYSEGHHIKPLGRDHNGPDIKENIIILCPNCHSKLDFGAVKLEKQNISTNSSHFIGNEYIDYHNNYIYNIQ